MYSPFFRTFFLNFVAVAFVFAAKFEPAFAQVTTVPVTLDGSALGRTLDGFGAVSGGGNTSRLLPDYPAKQRAEILDYLFKPKFGASLSDLKVEVGGDINSTQGSEPSHMHTSTDQNYQRGFEWWLMQQAKQRNPKIVLDCLAWGAPGWVGNGQYWSPDMMDYYIKFIKAAKQVYGLNITSVGGKNESGYDTNWYIAFRKALNDNGLSSVKLVGSDDWGPSWLNIASDSLKNPALAQALDVFAGHVTWIENPTVPSAALLATGKPLWDTEMHNYINGTAFTGFDDEISLVHGFNYNYIHAKISKTLFWYLESSTYPECPYQDIGMIRATSPWSGHYEVLPELWGYAHVGQFTEPGWHFLENGGNALLPDGGTYTTLESPTGQYSIIAETKGATSPQLLQFTLTGGLSTNPVHVWTSDASAQFVRAADITPVNGAYSITLAPDTIYSITTTTGQQKGSYPASPKDADFPLPYVENYQNYRVGSQPRYHFDFSGSFEIARKTVGTGLCLRQAATTSNSGWGQSYLPETFLGSGAWKDYSASADAYIENAGSVSLYGRVNYITESKTGPPGYALTVTDSGAWTLSDQSAILAKGSAAVSANQWHNLKLVFLGTSITALIDQQQVAQVTDASYGSGLIGLGTSGNYAQFDNVKIQPNP